MGVYRRATPPTPTPAGSRHQTPIHTRALVHWDLDTIHAPITAADLWQTPHRPTPAQGSETPNPTRQTTDTPTYQASKSHHAHLNASNHDCVPVCVRAAEQAAPDRPSAILRYCTNKTASTTTSRQRPDAAHYIHRHSTQMT